MLSTSDETQTFFLGFLRVQFNLVSTNRSSTTNFAPLKHRIDNKQHTEQAKFPADPGLRNYTLQGRKLPSNFVRKKRNSPAGEKTFCSCVAKFGDYFRAGWGGGQLNRESICVARVMFRF